MRRHGFPRWRRSRPRIRYAPIQPRQALPLPRRLLRTCTNPLPPPSLLPRVPFLVIRQCPSNRLSRTSRCAHLRTARRNWLRLQNWLRLTTVKSRITTGIRRNTNNLLRLCYAHVITQIGFVRRFFTGLTLVAARGTPILPRRSTVSAIPSCVTSLTLPAFRSMSTRLASSDSEPKVSRLGTSSSSAAGASSSIAVGTPSSSAAGASSSRPPSPSPRTYFSGRYPPHVRTSDSSTTTESHPRRFSFEVAGTLRVPSALIGVAGTLRVPPAQASRPISTAAPEPPSASGPPLPHSPESASPSACWARVSRHPKGRRPPPDRRSPVPPNSAS